MPTLPVTNKYQLKQAIKLMEGRKRPFVVTITPGKIRTTEQNRLQRLWGNEVSEQLGDTTPEEVRAYNKLHFGVPILRAENDAFAEAYDQHVKPLPYETKLALMAEPLDFPVTRLMNTDQKTRFLDALHAHWSGRGVVLTMPPDKRGMAA